MITFPETLNIAVLVADFFRVAVPFVGVAFLISGGLLITNIIKKA